MMRWSVAEADVQEVQCLAAMGIQSVVCIVSGRLRTMAGKQVSSAFPVVILQWHTKGIVSSGFVVSR